MSVLLNLYLLDRLLGLSLRAFSVMVSLYVSFYRSRNCHCETYLPKSKERKNGETNCIKYSDKRILKILYSPDFRAIFAQDCVEKRRNSSMLTKIFLDEFP